MMKQLYKNSLADIVVSRELIDKTKLLMKQKRNNIPKYTVMIRYASLAACFTVILFSAIIIPKWITPISSDNNPLNVPPSASSGQQYSALRQISINQFGDNMDGQQPIFYGPMINRTEVWTFDQFCNLLGFDPLPTEVPQGLSLIKSDKKDISFHDNRRVDFYNKYIQADRMRVQKALPLT